MDFNFESKILTPHTNAEVRFFTLAVCAGKAVNAGKDVVEIPDDMSAVPVEPLSSDDYKHVVRGLELLQGSPDYITSMWAGLVLGRIEDSELLEKEAVTIVLNNAGDPISSSVPEDAFVFHPETN